MCGIPYVREIAHTLSQPTQWTISFPECVATHRRNTIRGKQATLRKILDVQKRCVYTVEPTFAMIEGLTSTSLAAKV